MIEEKELGFVLSNNTFLILETNTLSFIFIPGLSEK